LNGLRVVLPAEDDDLRAGALVQERRDELEGAMPEQDHVGLLRACSQQRLRERLGLVH